ncbi:L-serine ammonia-lyase, iron-sulfur-dependent subunit beta [Thermotoga profunda]|uniref:L-serine ammonia-lyase, iron-sulfur-dependent subunit beta n=1 Tax=Thermotoga profunda TaxID=1508420 RepID=UPI000596F102|nr:L-serine ammonia-lyase, iron-sulfur-dependent subunit beta [Thermotoga profunda]
MNFLEIIGPVMVGPSSSHTLGAMRISRFVYKMIGQVPKQVDFLLHGSFAKTFKGHGTDRALLAGIMGLRYDDERIKDSYLLAKKIGLNYFFTVTDLGNVHPNTVKIKIQTDKNQHEVEGCSIGGGAIKITKIDDVECNLSWHYDTLIIVNKDEPGALSRILSGIRTNIANLYLRRINLLQAKALTIIELDSPVENFQELSKLSPVLEYYFVPKDDFL